MRSITAQRFLASYAITQGIRFVEDVDGQPVAHDPLVVMSPVCFLPAVIAYTRSLTKQVLGQGAEVVLEISTQIKPESLLGVSQQLSALDASIAGVFRTLLLSRGFDLLCADHVQSPGILHLEKLESYFSSVPGRAYLMGEADIDLDLPNEMVQEIASHSLSQS